MDHVVLIRVENKANKIPNFEQIVDLRNLLCIGKQLLSNKQIWIVIMRIVEPFSAWKVRLKRSKFVFPFSTVYKDKSDCREVLGFKTVGQITTNCLYT